MNRLHFARTFSLTLAFLVAAGCTVGMQETPGEEEAVEQTAEAFTAPVGVAPPDFSLPWIGYYCNAIWPSAGWTLNWTQPGDINTNPCGDTSTASFTRTGMYSNYGDNIVEAHCDGNYYWIEEGYGTAPFNAIFADVTGTDTQGNCRFDVSIGTSLRSAIPGPAAQPAPAAPGLTPPATNWSYVFNPTTFANNLMAKLSASTPTPVGYQIAVRDPQGSLVYSHAVGSVTGPANVVSTEMTTKRRFDVASMSKTITATATVAALEDIANRAPGAPSLAVTLDSSIYPYLPGNWKPSSTVKDVSFRMVLRHTAGFCDAVTGWGDSYAAVQSMVETGTKAATKGMFQYCDGGYALLRILLPYLVDGPASYKTFEANPTINARVTAASYRSYIRGRIFSRLGLPTVDDFYAGSAPATIYFDKTGTEIPDLINIPGTNGYNQLADNMMLTAGSGNWTLSAEEYSKFIASLWKGEIVSAASVGTMIARNNNNVGIGNYGSQITLPDGTQRSDFNENGSGSAGGPQGIWTTFFNGYTAVLLVNTDWNVVNNGIAWMEAAFKPAVTPSAWTCSASYYATKDGCDCNCGAWDPDCDAPAFLYGCAAGQKCVKSGGTGVCAAP